MSSEQYRWLLVDDFVEQFNEHMAQAFVPSEHICVDESISRWYGQGGHWINMGLTCYVAIDRKPENGCEIQNAACGQSGIMLRLKLVKTAAEESTTTQVHDEHLLHGTNVLKFLVSPWSFSGRIVCADSYFASVGAAEELKRNGLKFIGVVKTATKKYPMAYLQALELQGRGDRRGLVARDAEGRPSLIACVWMERERRYFISNAHGLAPGTPYVRQRWRQLDQTLNADPVRQTLVVEQPKLAEVYYDVCGKIDQHNRDRQDTLGVERKLVTTKWDKRVGLSIFSMIVVNTYRMYMGLTYPRGEGRSKKLFYEQLAEELILNKYDAAMRMPRNSNELPNRMGHCPPAINHLDGTPRMGTHAHLTPTKRKRKGTNFALQGNCRVCRKKTKYLCSCCKDAAVATSKEAWICSTEKGKLCFSRHLQDVHSS